MADDIDGIDDIDRHDSFQQMANRYEVAQMPGEDDMEFRARVAKVILERGHDPAYALEAITGKPVECQTKEDYPALMWMQLVQGRMQDEKFKEAGDSYHNMPLKDFKSLVSGLGFKGGLSYDFSLHGNIEEYNIWYLPSRGFLLKSQSYWNKEVADESRLYYEVNNEGYDSWPDDKKRMSLRHWERGSSSPINIGDDYVGRTVDVDVRNGLVKTLRSLKGAALNNPWKHFEEHHLYLCDYSEKGRPMGEATREKLLKLPLEARVMLGCPY